MSFDLVNAVGDDASGESLCGGDLVYVLLVKDGGKT
jgi:hypothetical protein